MGETDLREIDIHPNASIGTVVRAMSCLAVFPAPAIRPAARSDATVLGGQEPMEA